jgi:hypothetical protein
MIRSLHLNGCGNHRFRPRGRVLVWNARAASMRSLALMNSLPVRSDDTDLLAADARELYR